MFDRIQGEKLEGLGEGHIVVPLSKWADSEFWSAARAIAEKAFFDAGAMLPITIQADDVLVQEYPNDGKLAFIFARNIAGETMFVPQVFELSERVQADLRVTGHWGVSTH